MKRSSLCGTAASLLCVGLLTAGSAVVAAQDQRSQRQEEYSTPNAQPSSTQSHSPSSKQDVMKECVKREHAGDNTMSESEARKACHDALRAERENQDNEPQPHHHQ
jgi:hypothetical protein